MATGRDQGHFGEPNGQMGWDGSSSARGIEGGTPPASTASAWSAQGRDAIMRIPVDVRIVLGVARMPVAKLLGLDRGAIIPLDRKVGEPVDIVVNDRVVARGEVVVLDEEAARFGVSIREVVDGRDE